MSVKVRFAPSPTGKLHIGNIRTATVTWLFAKKNNGHFLLRIDDTDQERSKEEYVDAIKSDLTWLGLTWDDMARQRERLERYDECIEKLKQDGRLYPCYETSEELSLKRKSLLGRGLPPVYDRSALDLTDEEKAKFEAEGRQPHWRFKLNHAPIEWNDHVRGEVKFEGKDLSDPVLIREDGSPLYHICSVIDDIDFGITHIIRGEDHVANTASHIQMFEALGAKAPDFAHLALLSGKDGDKLSKRIGSLSIEDLRDDQGLEAMSITSLLAKMGTSDPTDAFMTLEELAEGFDFSKFSRSMAKFDSDELSRINAKIVHALSYDDVKPRLDAMGLTELSERFWNSVQANLTKVSDIKEWWAMARERITPVIEDADFINEAATLLPDGEWDENTWNAWANAVKEKTGRKGKLLFMPLRQALTGMDHGPELKVLLPLIGPERAKRRLSGGKS